MQNLQRSAEGGLDKLGRRASRRGAEKSQWTIKGLDHATIDKSRQAARKRGMRIGAWVAEALEQAASGDLDDLTSIPSHTSQELREMFESFEARLTHDLKRIQEMSVETEKDVRIIQRTLLESLSALSK